MAPLETDWHAAFCTPRCLPRVIDVHVNYLVLGESGLGKTTFINNLVSSFKVANAGRVRDGGATALKDFQADPSALCTVLEPMDIPESSRRLNITIQDAPGWGDDINVRRYLQTMATFVLEKRAKDYDALGGGSRNLDEAAMCGQLQNSITACLYFMPPHRVKKIDLILMAAISQLVTIIPVIGKSDCMTVAELAAYRREVLHMLNNPDKHVQTRSSPLEVSIFKFKQAAMAHVGLEHGLPVAVMGSPVQEPCDDHDLLAEVGPLGPETPTQPVRRYAWGHAYPLNRWHQSDLIPLKRLLLGDQVDSLYAMLDDSFSRYRAFCEQYDECDQQLGAVVHGACEVGAHLEYDDYIAVKRALTSAKAAMSTLSEENRLLSERLAVAEKEKKQLAERVRMY